MSDENKTSSVTPEHEGIDFKEAQNMTVGDAMRKESELKAGVTEEDSVLDKYIKQHREEVASQKFEAKATDFEQLDTAALDVFIQKQREELSQLMAEDEEQAEEENSAEEVSTDSEETPSAIPVNEDSEPAEVDKVVEEETDLAEEIPLPNDEEVSETAVPTEPNETIALATADANQPLYKNKRVIIGSLVALVLAIFGGAYGLNKMTESSQTATSSSSTMSKSSTSTSKSSSTSKKAATAKKNAQAFTDLYKTFFTDSEQTKLKNSEFGNLSKLEEALKKLEKTSYYDDAKSKYDSLNRQISAIQAVNAKFNADVIVDGNKVDGTAKSDANFDDLASSVLNTGNASLDSLLQSAISTGRDQLSAAAGDTSQSQAEQSTATSSAQSSASTGTTTDTATASQSSSVNLERSRSRVPYNDSAIADTSNAAWTFSSGVLEKIVATAQARGYIQGNNYILEPVNIINGNGYYNMFKPDGTYLFSINAKTGYFVGNAPGNADSLDY